MKTLVRIWDQVAALADDPASGDVARATRSVFVASKLGLCLLALAAPAFSIALAGAPSLAACAAFAFALAPLGAFLIVTRTGDLARAAALSGTGFLGFAVALAYAAPQLAGPAALFAAIAPLEALFAGSLPLIALAGAGAMVAILAVAALAAQTASASPVAFALLACVAGGYLVALAFGALRIASVGQREMKRTDAAFAALASMTDDLVLRLDRTGAVVGGVNMGVRLLETPAVDFMGRGLFERVNVADRPLFLKTLSDACDARLPTQAEIRVRAAASEGSGFGLVRLRVVPLAASGASVRMLATLADVSAARAQEEKLAEARAVAQESTASRDRFLANISHELRTPLNAIIGFSEILGSEVMPLDAARRREYAGIINASGQHLLQVVNSILDMSKIESGSFQIAAEHFELPKLVDQCCDMVRLKAEEAGVTLTRDTPANMPDIVGDKRAVKQILINLVSNSVKFTPAQGKVAVRVRLCAEGVAIEVEDNGIGVRPRDLVRLGDPFFQAKDSYDRPYEGTGLGLSVVRGLVGLHGGAMRIESGPGEGTRVTVTLPLDCRTAPNFARTGVARIETIARGPFRALSAHEKVKQIA